MSIAITRAMINQFESVEQKRAYDKIKSIQADVVDMASRFLDKDNDPFADGNREIGEVLLKGACQSYKSSCPTEHSSVTGMRGHCKIDEKRTVVAMDAQLDEHMSFRTPDDIPVKQTTHKWAKVSVANGQSICQSPAGVYRLNPATGTYTLDSAEPGT